MTKGIASIQFVFLDTSRIQKKLTNLLKIQMRISAEGKDIPGNIKYVLQYKKSNSEAFVVLFWLKFYKGNIMQLEWL